MRLLLAFISAHWTMVDAAADTAFELPMATFVALAATTWLPSAFVAHTVPAFLFFTMAHLLVAVRPTFFASSPLAIATSVLFYIHVIAVAAVRVPLLKARR